MTEVGEKMNLQWKLTLLTFKTLLPEPLYIFQRWRYNVVTSAFNAHFDIGDGENLPLRYQTV